MKIEHQALLTDQERGTLLEPETLNIGQYTAYRPTRLCDFIVSIDASPLVALIDTANYGSRIYELMSIRRPGDILHYLSVHIIDVGEEVEKFVKEKVLPFFADFDAPFKDVPFYEFDGCFEIRGEDTESFESSWCYHRESGYWKDKLDPILLLVEDVQRRIRKKSDYLLQHEINLIDHKRHRIDYLPIIDRLVCREVMVSPETTLEKPLFDLICSLITNEKVQSVSCPFQDYAVWRVLVEEQVKCAETTGLPPRQALFLSGPDSGLPHIDASNWGGEAHVPYEGATEGDLFIYPSWRTFHPDRASLKAGTGGKQCYYLLIEKDYGEIECATRTVVGNWVLYESKLPYEKCDF